MNYSNEALVEVLARQYVLGTMSRRARRRFSDLIDNDPKIEDVVFNVEAEYLPMAWALEPVEPSALLWRRIKKRLAPRAASPRSPNRWALASGFLAAALVAVSVASWQVWTQPPEVVVETIPSNPEAGVVSGNDGQPIWYIQLFDRESAVVTVQSPPDAVDDQDYQLWILRDDGVPISVGLLPQTGRADIELTAAARDALASGNVLAVSLEPLGGSPEAVPTGPVLFTTTIVGT